MTLPEIILPGSHACWTVFCDFDGTISGQDVTDTLMAQFGMPGWQQLEERWVQGEIGSLACLSGQVALLDASRQQLESCLDNIELDPHFAAFARWSRLNHVPLYIVSDGLDYAIAYLLRRERISGVPIFANRLQQIAQRRWRLSSPYSDPLCSQASGTCKCVLVRRLSRQHLLTIGDGRSDFCVAAKASHVLAKSSLIAECQRAALPFTPFHDFSEAQTYFEALLTRPQASS